MNRNCPTTPHFCGRETCPTNVPGKTNPFCAAKGGPVAHMSEHALSCMRIDGHTGVHKAYQLSVSVPVEW